jgi:hypothetical protein
MLSSAAPEPPSIGRSACFQRRSGAPCSPSTPFAARSTTSPTSRAKTEAKSARLQFWREEVDAALCRFCHDADLARAAGARASTMGCARKISRPIIAGMEMDSGARLRIADCAELDLYCDRVACAVGRLSTRIFGAEPATGDELAAALGRALQLTNILRDLEEDAPRPPLSAGGHAGGRGNSRHRRSGCGSRSCRYRHRVRSAGGPCRCAVRGCGRDHRPLRAPADAAGPDHDGGLPADLAPAEGRGAGSVSRSRCPCRDWKSCGLPSATE